MKYALYYTHQLSSVMKGLWLLHNEVILVDPKHSTSPS